MKRARFALGLVLLLSACAGWNEEPARFATYREFQASKYGNGGFLPSTLVPASARDIDVKYNIDSTEIEVKFAFAAADAERVIGPFRSPDQVRIHELEREGRLPPSKVQSPMFIRCNERMVEYLQIAGMAQAHYWTRVDPQLRQTACKRVDDAAMIST